MHVILYNVVIQKKTKCNGTHSDAAHEARKVIHMTYHELVKKVQTALAKADASKVEEHIAVQVNVTGEAEGIFYMEIAEGVPYVAPFDYKDNDAVLTADAADILAVVQGKISMETAIAEGKIAHAGDYAKTLTLAATIPAKKTAGRKPAAKKTEAAEKKAAAPKKTAAKKAEAPAAEKKAAAPKKAAAKKTAAAKAEAPAAEAEKPKRGRKPAAKKADK